MLDNITPQQNSQEQMTPEDAKASMGIATFLMDNLMPKAEQPPTEAPSEPQQAPSEPETPETTPDTPDPDFEALKAEFDSKLQEMEKSTKDTIRAEIGGIKDMIKEALQEDATDEE